MIHRSSVAYLSAEGVRHGESTVDPAEGVDHVRRHAVDDAADRLAHILGGGDDQTAGEQEHRGEGVVQAKDGIVRLNVLPLEVALQATQQLVHLGAVRVGRRIWGGESGISLKSGIWGSPPQLRAVFGGRAVEVSKNVLGDARF